MNTDQKLQELANVVAVGERLRTLCPECNGGTRREHSLTIRREGLTAHCTCYRGTCPLGYRRIQTEGMPRPGPSTSHAPRRTHWEGVTVPATQADFDMNVFDTDVPLRLTEDGRVVIPVLDSKGVRRGEVVRQDKPYDESKPKSITLCEEGYQGGSWFYPKRELARDGSPVLCYVEDQLSAMRLAKHGVIGVALLGVTLSPDKLRECHWWGDRPINLALDADASAHARRQALRLRNQVDLRVHRLFNDVKDMDLDELRNFLAVLSV